MLATKKKVPTELRVVLTKLHIGTLNKAVTPCLFVPLNDYSGNLFFNSLLGPSYAKFEETTTGFKAKFVYAISYSDYSQRSFIVKVRHIKKIYGCEDPCIIYLKVTRQVSHYLEEICKFKLLPSRPKTIYDPLVNEPSLSDYYRLRPIICMQVNNETDVAKVQEYLATYGVYRKGPTKTIQYSGEFERVRQSVRWQNLVFSKRMHELDFSLQYLILCLLSAGIITPDTFPFELFDFLKANLVKDGQKILEKLAMRRCKLKADSILAETVEILEHIKDFPEDDEIRAGFMKVRRVVVTPSVILCQLPTLQESCRALRKYVDSEKVLRVTFKDHELKQIRCCNSYIDHIKGLLHFGLKLGSRNFIFLAYSQSQIREQSCWLIWDSLNPCHILENTGTYNLSQHPATVAARIGHAFATTTPIVTLEPEDIKIKPDIIRNKHIFTDGAGLLSSELCQLCNEKLNTDSVAFQIRLGGSKGVLKLDPKIRGIVLRPSMNKFVSDETTLEVIRVAKFMKGYLNKELVVLLETLGVPKKTFVSIQNEWVSGYLKMMTEDDGRMALKQVDWPDYLHCLMQYATKKKGECGNQFMKELMMVEVAKRLKDIRKKNKIYIEKSCRLIGVIDESGLLQSNEVFIQFSRSKDSPRTILNTRVFVTRNPCLHPGDIRILNAVYKKELAHLWDVIVFSSNGARPTQNMMSCGDLDGDIYFICWDERIFPKMEVSLMENSKKPTKVCCGTYNTMRTVIESIIDFFCTFLHSDNIGRISTLYLAHSDSSTQGALSRKCIELVKLHSVAVDYAKHGERVKSDMLVGYRVDEWPDFMEGKGKVTYLSLKALGMMYRDVEDAFNEAMEVYKNWQEGIEKIDEDLLVEGYEEYLVDAVDQYMEYADVIRSLMKMYGVKSEVEILSGSIVKLDRVYRTKGREYEIRREITEIMRGIIRKYNRKVDEMPYTNRLKMASARYFVCNSGLEQNMALSARITEKWKIYKKHEADKKKVWSYPWILSGKELLEIKQKPKKK